MGCGRTPTPSPAWFPTRPAGGAPAQAPEPTLEQALFSHPHRSQRKVFQGKAGEEVANRSLTRLFLGSKSQPPPAQCRSRTGRAARGVFTGGRAAGATPTGPSCSTTADAQPGTVCSALPHVEGPRTGLVPPQGPSSSNPHFPGLPAPQDPGAWGAWGTGVPFRTRSQ